MSKVSNFVKEVVARIKGDDATATALKNERKATSAIKQQISALELKEVEAEDELETARTTRNEALFPSESISDSKYYVQNIARAEEALKLKQAALDTVRESKQFYQGLLEEISKEVEADQPAA